MKKARLIWLAPALLPFSTGCEKQIVAERIPVPERWLTCAEQPAPPGDNTDKAVAGFIVALISAGEDCRSNVAAIRAWSKAP